MTGYVYIVANKPNGTIYTGVTNDIARRAFEHREGGGSEFTRKYGCELLVWYEEHDDIRDAIQREKSIKRYLRAWKVELIEAMNPHWVDLYPELW
ncbi:MAG: GIY-YIG nuclease family protein [Pseudomonadota bacterium]